MGRDHLQHPAMMTFAECLEIDIMDLETFFPILSARGSKAVDLETFVEGCIKLRGQARSMDVMDLLIKAKEIAADVIVTKEHVLGTIDPNDHPELVSPCLGSDMDHLADNCVIRNSEPVACGG